MSRELLTEVLSALREADNLLSQYSIGPQDQEAIENIQSLLQLANLQSAKPEQAQTAVGSPEPINRDEVPGRYAEKYPWDEVGAYMDGYNTATAKTAEAVRELVECISCCVRIIRNIGSGATTIGRQEADPESALNQARTLLTKYAPKKEQDNG